MNNHPTRSKDHFLVFGDPLIEEAEIQEIMDSIKSGWLGTGPKVARFENGFKLYKCVEHAVALNSCSAAMHLSLLSAGIKHGDEVITSALTFCATVNAIIHSGATPVPVDIDPLTMNMDPNAVLAQITPKTRAILPVHFAGRPCDMNALCDIVERYDLKMIEDCAHAIETEYKGRKSGTFGDFGCFSFYINKNLVTIEGGMVITGSEEDAAYIKMMSMNGMNMDAWARTGNEGYKHYHVVEAGLKYNMMDIQAAIGIHQLKRIERYWHRRQEIWHHYNESLADLPIALPAAPETETRHAYHIYNILIDELKTSINRDAFLNAMIARNIGIGVHYLSIPEHPYYRNTFGWKPEQYPIAMRIGRQTVSLPISAKLSDGDVEDVIMAVRKIIKYTHC